MDDPVQWRDKRTAWLAGAGLLATLSLSLFSYGFFRAAGDGATAEAFRRLGLDELTGVLTAIPLVFLAPWLVARWPPRRAFARRWVPIWLLALLAYSTGHTVAIVLVRSALYPALGLVHRTRLVPTTFGMELGHDLVAFVAFAGLASLLAALQKAAERERRATALGEELVRAELHNLRLQLQPHFLFNALNTVSSVMYDDPRAADEMLARLAGFLRLSLSTTERQEVPLHAEIEALRTYVGILTARFGARLRVDIQVDPAAQGALVPSLLLQPLVENAVRHGGLERTGAGSIAVAARAEGAQLALEVLDDGPGAATVKPGVGLGTTRSRLRLLYGDLQELHAGNAPGGGFRVAIRLPLRLPGAA